jgi:Ca2+-binding EF-hand superfamily protein
MVNNTTNSACPNATQELHNYLTRVLARKVKMSEAKALFQSLDFDKNGTIEYIELLQGTLLSSGSPDTALVDACDFFLQHGT